MVRTLLQDERNTYLRDWYKRTQRRRVNLNRVNRNTPNIKKWRLKYDSEYYLANKEHIKERHQKHREAHPEIYRARQKTRDALKSGRLKKQPCYQCGNKKSEAHHEDYSKPLKIIWLCRIHHKEVERMAL